MARGSLLLAGFLLIVNNLIGVQACKSDFHENGRLAVLGHGEVIVIGLPRLLSLRFSAGVLDWLITVQSL